jgi:capsular polysaccharide biosynthesis protein
VSFFDPRYNNQIEKLLVPSHAGCSGTFNYTVINGMANFIKTQKSITTLDTTSPEKIYISRSKAGRRRIKNDDAVIGLLEPLGFKTLYMEDYSFTEQVKLLSGCRYLISMHGAGLTNEMFMEAGSSVLEIRHPYDKLNNCYYLMATAIKLNYFYFLSDTDNANPHDADVYVNIALFKECINTFLSFNNA